MELKGEDYLVTYSETKDAVEFFGTIRLRDSSDYASIDNMLISAHRRTSGTLIMDFRNLQFLNSAGINVISKFVISTRRAGAVMLKVLGNSAITWQQKSLKNLQKLWPLVQIEIT